MWASAKGIEWDRSGKEERLCQLQGGAGKGWGQEEKTEGESRPKGRGGRRKSDLIGSGLLRRKGGKGKGEGMLARSRGKEA